jgi:hypothetical protein
MMVVDFSRNIGNDHEKDCDKSTWQSVSSSLFPDLGVSLSGETGLRNHSTSHAERYETSGRSDDISGHDNQIRPPNTTSITLVNLPNEILLAITVRIPLGIGDIRTVRRVNHHLHDLIEVHRAKLIQEIAPARFPTAARITSMHPRQWATFSA